MQLGEKVILIIGILFLFIYCEKETPVKHIEPMDTFYPHYNFQPLLIPQGLASSTDSMARVIHGHLKLANSLEENIKWIYIVPDEFIWQKADTPASRLTQTNLEDYDMWDVEYRVKDDLEFYDDVTAFVKLRVIDDSEWCFYCDTLTEVFLKSDVYLLNPLFVNTNYIDSGAKKDFSTGYMRKKYLYDDGLLHCYWDWEMSDDLETYKMSVILKDMRIYDPDWPPPETSPGRTDILQNKSGSGEMSFYIIADFGYNLQFSAQWDSLGSGQYQIFDQNTLVIKHGVW